MKFLKYYIIAFTAILNSQISSSQIVVNPNQQFLYKKVVASGTSAVGAAASCPGGRIEYRHGGKFCCYDKETTECYKIVSSAVLDEVDDELDRQSIRDYQLMQEAIKILRAKGKAGLNEVRDLWRKKGMQMPKLFAAMLQQYTRDELGDELDRRGPINYTDLQLAVRSIGILVQKGKAGINEVRALWAKAGKTIPAGLTQKILELRGDELEDEDENDEEDRLLGTRRCIGGERMVQGGRVFCCRRGRCRLALGAAPNVFNPTFGGGIFPRGN